jgi:lysophospholipase L1-like esterase
MNKRFALIYATIAFGLMPLAYSAEKLPDFLNKVQLHNFDGYELTPDGSGVSVYRLPSEMLGHLSEAGAKQMTHARSSEIRFVLEDGAKLEDVTIHLKSNRNTWVMFCQGDDKYNRIGLGEKKGAEPYIPPSLVGKTAGPGYRDKAVEVALRPVRLKRGTAENEEASAGPKPAQRFPEQVCRILLDGGVITLTGIDGDIRPPRPDELPPVLVSYGTSISQGAAATRPDRSFTALTAAALGYDLRNLGCSGSAFCEKEMADYLAKQPGDLFLFEISVNMAGKGFTVDEFRKRASYLIDQVTKAHPEVPVVCVSILTLGADRDEPKSGLVPEYRQALEEVCGATQHKNVHLVDGTKLLSFEGLAKDNIHPTDVGHAEIATKLVPQIQVIINKKEK